MRVSDASLVNALQAHVETLREQLAAAEARIERQAADFTARDAQHAAELAVERDKAERARAELASIADRLAQIAEANQRRWWRCWVCLVIRMLWPELVWGFWCQGFFDGGAQILRWLNRVRHQRR